MLPKREGETDREASERNQANQRGDPPLYFFEVLAKGSNEVLIDHKAQIYRLRATKNGKLILNK